MNKFCAHGSHLQNEYAFRLSDWLRGLTSHSAILAY